MAMAIELVDSLLFIGGFLAFWLMRMNGLRLADNAID